MSSQNEFKIAMQFLTRLPVAGEIEQTDENFARSARFYPAVGLIVGVIAAAVFFVADIFLPNYLASAFALLSAVVVTGGLHEDGLADAFDLIDEVQLESPGEAEGEGAFSGDVDVSGGF